MPKAPRSKLASTSSHAHLSSAKPFKRQFAVQDNAVERVDVGAMGDADADEILRGMAMAADGTSEHGEHGKMKKKDKIAMKKDAFLDSLPLPSTQPYSKSHARRVKRKAREQVAGGLTDIQDVLSDIVREVDEDAMRAGETIAQSAVNEKSRGKKGKGRDMDVEDDTEGGRAKTGSGAGGGLGVIGEGRGRTLSKTQRKRALEAERLRHPLILKNPDFAKNPFETIRTHAANTLVKHQPGVVTSS